MAKRGRPKHPDLLTPREQEVLALIRDGLSNPQIAERLGIGVEGVRYHVSEILGKLGVASREEAARWREDARPWWLGGALALWRPPLRAASVVAASVVAIGALAGLALLAFLLVRSDGEDREAGGSFSSVYFVDQQHGWVGGTLNGTGVILATADGGHTWQKQSTPEREVWRLTFINGQIGWALAGDSSGSDLLRTTDGGASWIKMSTIDLGPVSAEAQRAGLIDFISPDIGWAVTTASSLLKTTDSGHTWTDAGLNGVRSVCFGDELHGWVWTINSTSSEPIHKMLRTSDGAVTWIQTELKSGEIQCLGAKDVWARSPGPFVGGMIVDYVLWHTADGGSHWNPVLGHQSIGPLVDSIPTDPGPQPGPWTIGNDGSAYFVGFCVACQEVGTSTLVVTHDGGATWSTPVVLTELPRAHALSFSDAMHGWAAGLYMDARAPHRAYAAILATTDGGQTWTQQYP